MRKVLAEHYLQKRGVFGVVKRELRRRSSPQNITMQFQNEQEYP